MIPSKYSQEEKQRYLDSIQAGKKPRKQRVSKKQNSEPIIEQSNEIQPPKMADTIIEPTSNSATPLDNNTPPIPSIVSSTPPSSLDDFNPLAEAVTQRDYTKGLGNSSTPPPIPDIPEPIFIPPTGNPPPLGDASIPKPPPPINPAMNGMDSKNKREAAKAAVDAFFLVYGMLHDYSQKKVKFPKAELNALIRKHEIDLRLPMVDEDGELTETTLGDFITNFNEQAPKAFVVTVEFKESVYEPMIRMCMDAGIGLTDKQAVAVAFAIDIFSKMIAFFQLKKMMRVIVNNNKQTATSGNVPPPPVAQQNKQPVENVEQEPEVKSSANIQEIKPLVPIKDPIIHDATESNDIVEPNE